jgi:hypothetical protein
MIPSPHFRERVLARVGEPVAGGPPRGAKRFIFPMKRPVNRSIDNGRAPEHRGAFLSIIGSLVPQVFGFDGLS